MLTRLLIAIVFALSLVPCYGSTGFGTTHGSGTTDSIELPFNSHATLRTYAMWAYRGGDGGGTGGRLLDKRVTAASDEIIFWNGSLSDVNYVRSWSGSSGDWRWAGETNFPVDTWVHIALTYDSGDVSNDPVLYYDGSLESLVFDTNPTGTVDTDSQNYVIGNEKQSDARNWDGRFANFAIWDRILSTGEISGLAARYSPDCFHNSLVSHTHLIRETIDTLNGTTTVTGTAVQPHPALMDCD